MKWLKFVLGLILGINLLAIDVAWADRGRGGHHFQQRHDAFNQRHHGFSHRRDAFRFRHDGFRDRGGFARAHRGHRIHRGTSIGLFVGVPLFWDWPPYYAYPPPVVAVPAPPPPVYIERDAPPGVPAPMQGYWYYCHDPEGYYPYVRECLQGWERVAPRPPR